MAGQPQFKKEFNEFAEDYNMRSNRLKFLTNERKYYITNQNEEEYVKLCMWLETVDGIINTMKPPLNSIVYRNIIEGTPLNELTKELGYTYNELCSKRAEAKRYFLYSITGRRIGEVPELSKIIEEANNI